MRVTQGMLSNNMLRNLMNSQQRMSMYMEQLYTGKKISRPSQDPVVAVKGINFRKQLAQVEQYKRNASEIHNWMDNSDTALDKATQSLTRVRELIIQANNDHYGPDERESIKQEVVQLKSHLIEIANTNVNNKYRSEEHTSELQSRGHLVCRLLLEKKKKKRKLTDYV